MVGKHEGRIAIVTGGGGGIGAATCDAFAREGAKVAVLDLDERLAEEAAKRARSLGADARAYRLDVTSSGDVDAVFARVKRELGGIDVLVNSAGVSNVGDHTQDLSDEIWNQTIAVMQTGYFFCTRAAGRAMLEQRSGSVIHISSIRGFSPNPGRLAYCAAKAAVLMMGEGERRRVGAVRRACQRGRPRRRGDTDVEARRRARALRRAGIHRPHPRAPSRRSRRRRAPLLIPRLGRG